MMGQCINYHEKKTVCLQRNASNGKVLLPYVNFFVALRPTGTGPARQLSYMYASTVIH